MDSIVENDSSLIGRDVIRFPYATGLHLFGKTELNLDSPDRMIGADILDRAPKREAAPMSESGTILTIYLSDQLRQVPFDLTHQPTVYDPGCVKTRIVFGDAESCSARGPESIQSC